MEPFDVYCPKLKCRGVVSVLTCLYSCPKKVKVFCTEYEKVFPKLKDFVVDKKYVEKYGEFVEVIPAALIRRRRRSITPP